MPSSKPLFIYLMDLYSPPKSKLSAIDTFDPALRNHRSELRIRLIDIWNWREKEDASRLMREGDKTLQGLTSDRLFTHSKKNISKFHELKV